MKLFRYLIISSAFLSIYSYSVPYTADDYLAYKGIEKSNIEIFDARSCSELPWFHRGVCEEAKKNIEGKIKALNTNLSSGALIHSIRESFGGGGQKVANEHYLQNYTLHSYTSNPQTIDFQTIDDIFLPLVTYFPLSGHMKGDGVIEWRYTTCRISITFFGKREICNDDVEEDLDLELDGEFSFDVYATLALNPILVFEKASNSYTFYMQPIVRLIAGNSDFNITKANLDSGGVIRTIVSGAEFATMIGNGTGLVMPFLENGIGGVTEHIKYHVEQYAVKGLGLSFLMAMDDAIGDGEFFTTLATWYEAIYSSEVDEYGKRALGAHELGINSDLSSAMDTDVHGIASIKIDGSSIQGKAYSQILPAISLLL